MQNRIKRVTIFCSSSSKINSAYYEDAKILAQELLKANIEIICGGGNGLMGVFSEIAKNEGGKVIGIRPKFLNELEKGNEKLHELYLVNDIRERKEKMLKDTDAVIALPGGSGTIDELFEVITLKRLGQFPKPILILNTLNYFDLLLDFYKKMISDNFMHQTTMKIFSVVNDPFDVCEVLKRNNLKGNIKAIQ